MTVVPDPLAAALLGADAPGGELLAAPVLLLLLLLLPLQHAATSIATPAAPATPAASLAGAGIRCTMEFLIVLVPCLSACPREFPLPQTAVGTGTGRDVNLDWMASGQRSVILATSHCPPQVLDGTGEGLLAARTGSASASTQAATSKTKAAVNSTARESTAYGTDRLSTYPNNPTLAVSSRPTAVATPATAPATISASQRKATIATARTMDAMPWTKKSGPMTLMSL